ncbi:MAG: hypothetical protein ACYCST_19770 [Acidimicrobiales bacterium]
MLSALQERFARIVAELAEAEGFARLLVDDVDQTEVDLGSGARVSAEMLGRIARLPRAAVPLDDTRLGALALTRADDEQRSGGP